MLVYGFYYTVMIKVIHGGSEGRIVTISLGTQTSIIVYILFLTLFACTLISVELREGKTVDNVFSFNEIMPLVIFYINNNNTCLVFFIL